MDIFKIVPENFFSLLSSKNKRLYASCIFRVFNIYEQSSILGIDKKIIVDDLINFFSKDALTNTFVDDNFEDEEVEISNKRDLANYILRRMEKCGWIFIDITNQYIEILNFTDYAITVIEGLLNLRPAYSVDDYLYDNETNSNEYHGYIYTIYSLLLNTNRVDYSVLLSEILKNTKLLIRSLRKLDSRLKDYISSVVGNAEIKDLMDTLINYKAELIDNNYNKLKTSDNINKYRLEIITNLEKIQNDEIAMSQIIDNYLLRFGDYNVSVKKAYRDISEIIEVFNSFDDLISEIDFKNKTYINSTIGKIKFLLSEEDNIIGKLNSLLKFIKTSNENNKLDKAMEMIKPMTTLKMIRGYSDSSLYTPRGSYAHNEAQTLDLSRFDTSDIDIDFYKEIRTVYDENQTLDFIKSHTIEEKFIASDVITYDCDIETIMKTIYSVVYSSDHGYTVTKLDKTVDHYKFRMSDFLIEKGE